MQRYLLLLCLYSCTGLAQEVYKVVNKDGSVTYTDQAPSDAQAVDLGPDNRMNSPTAKKNHSQVQAANKKPTPPKPEIEIVSPQPEATVRNNAGNMTIAAKVQNALKGGKFKLFIDNQLVSEQPNAVFTLQGINRGAHTFYITHTDNTGKTLASSSPQTFYLHQASRLINNQ